MVSDRDGMCPRPAQAARSASRRVLRRRRVRARPAGASRSEQRAGARHRRTRRSDSLSNHPTRSVRMRSAPRAAVTPDQTVRSAIAYAPPLPRCSSATPLTVVSRDPEIAWYSTMLQRRACPCTTRESTSHEKARIATHGNGIGTLERRKLGHQQRAIALRENARRLRVRDPRARRRAPPHATRGSVRTRTRCACQRSAWKYRRALHAALREFGADTEGAVHEQRGRLQPGRTRSSGRICPRAPTADSRKILLTHSSST